MKKNSAARRVATLGIMSSLALIFGYVEVLIPFNFGIPGVKLGLANLVVVVGLYMLSTPEAGIVDTVKVFAVSLLFGNTVSLLYSLAGAVLSFAVMALLKRIKGFGIIGVSVAGGVAHNIGQLVVAMLVMETLKLSYYLPVLLIAGVVTGLLIGIAGERIIALLRRMKGKGADGA